MTSFPPPERATQRRPPQLGQVRAHVAAAATSNGHLLELLAAGLAQDAGSSASPPASAKDATAQDGGRSGAGRTCNDH